MDQGQRRIPVTFAKRVVGRRMYGGPEHLHPAQGQPVRRDPDHLRQLGALHPGAALATSSPGTGSRTSCRTTSRRPSLIYIGLYFLLILVFTFFYVYVAFDPHQQADIIRKQGGFIPGIRPGPPTERYFAHILNRITVVGALFLAIGGRGAVASSCRSGTSTAFPFYGTTLLISVGVALETMRQIDSQLMMRNYEGFLK